MKLLIDDANIEKIKALYEVYPVDGVTTNPSILAKQKKDPMPLLKELRAFLGEDELHVQVTARDAEGMLADAKRIVSELGEQTYVKVPAIPEGFKAMKLIHAAGIRITATAIYTPMQAYLSAKAGASYCAPYVNRIDNMGFDGVAVAGEIQDIFEANDLPCEVLAASFKNSQQVLSLCRYGIGAATLAPDVMENLVKNPAIDAAVEVFLSDFADLVGDGRSMKDL